MILDDGTVYRPNDFRACGKSRKAQRKRGRKVFAYVLLVLRLTGRRDGLPRRQWL
jgi:hypothetical protein